jgi:hypothetical protein
MHWARPLVCATYYPTSSSCNVISHGVSYCCGYAATTLLVRMVQRSAKVQVSIRTYARCAQAIDEDMHTKAAATKGDIASLSLGL